MTDASAWLGLLITSAITITAIFPLSDYLFPLHSLTLRCSWDQADHREDRKGKIQIAAISSAIGLVAGVLLEALKHKLWP